MHPLHSQKLDRKAFAAALALALLWPVDYESP
jgi:hypothetical protein